MAYEDSCTGVQAQAASDGSGKPQQAAHIPYAAYLLNKCILLDSILGRSNAVHRCLLSVDEDDSLKKALGFLRERQALMDKVDELDRARPETEVMLGTQAEQAQYALLRQLLQRIQAQENANLAKIDEIVGHVSKGIQDINNNRKEVFAYLHANIGMEGNRLDTKR